MLNNDEWVVVENAGYIGEVHLEGFNSHEEAKQYIEDNYTEEEVGELHVTIICDDSYEY